MCNNKCLTNKDCDGLVAFRGSEDKTYVNFTLFGRIPDDLKYVAVGISTDGEMVHFGGCFIEVPNTPKFSFSMNCKYVYFRDTTGWWSAFATETTSPSTGPSTLNRVRVTREWMRWVLRPIFQLQGREALVHVCDFSYPGRLGRAACDHE